MVLCHYGKGEECAHVKQFIAGLALDQIQDTDFRAALDELALIMNVSCTSDKRASFSFLSFSSFSILQCENLSAILKKQQPINTQDATKK
jgi:hypothetical protein